MAACGAGAAANTKAAADRLVGDRLPDIIPIFPRCIPGWTEDAELHRGTEYCIEYRWAEGKIERLPELAKDLVDQKVDIILAGGSLGAEAAKHATSVIPIVTAGAGDLVDLGLVASLARPGGNLTGFVAVSPDAAAKRFQIIREIRPEARRAAVLWNSASSNAKLEWAVTKEFAAANDIAVELYGARDVDELRTRA